MDDNFKLGYSRLDPTNVNQIHGDKQPGISLPKKKSKYKIAITTKDDAIKETLIVDYEIHAVSRLLKLTYVEPYEAISYVNIDEIKIFTAVVLKEEE